MHWNKKLWTQKIIDRLEFCKIILAIKTFNPRSFWRISRIPLELAKLSDFEHWQLRRSYLWFTFGLLILIAFDWSCAFAGFAGLIKSRQKFYWFSNSKMMNCLRIKLKFSTSKFHNLTMTGRKRWCDRLGNRIAFNKNEESCHRGWKWFLSMKTKYVKSCSTTWTNFRNVHKAENSNGDPTLVYPLANHLLSNT